MPKSQYHHGDLRRRLLDDAEEILVREGGGGLTMRRLSERAGVSHTAPYRHFADKTALLSAVAERGFRILRRYLAGAAERREEGALDWLEGIALGYVDFAIAHPNHYRLMFGTESLTRSPPEELQAAARAAFDIGVEAFRECREEGILRAEDPRLLTTLAWATIHGLSTLLIDRQVRTMDSHGAVHALATDGESGAMEDPRRMVRMAIATLIRGMRR